MSASTRDSSLNAAAAVFASPGAYADEEFFHRATALLREQCPFPLVQVEGYPAFYAVTRHADVYEIATHHQAWRNEPRSVLQSLAAEQLQLQMGAELETLIHIDDPRHRQLREITADWFKPRALSRLDDRVAELARKAVDRMAAAGGSCDFAVEIAMPYPLEVILSLLGLPESDYQLIYTLTQQIFGNDDPELARADAADSAEAFTRVVLDFFTYFAELVAERKAHPTEDMASVIANATINGQPIAANDQLSYYTIIATAGHDTTSAAIAGGIKALAEHPDQLDRLREDPGLIPRAVEEIIRWVTPVKSFMRNAVTPYDVGGQHFEPGDAVLLSYWSANRDESVFADPMTFDVARDPNRHLAFGFGAHYCLGAVLARMEISAFLRELLPRLDSIELAGSARLSESVFVSGLKHLPIHYRLR